MCVVCGGVGGREGGCVEVWVGAWVWECGVCGGVGGCVWCVCVYVGNSVRVCVGNSSSVSQSLALDIIDKVKHYIR